MMNSTRTMLLSPKRMLWITISLLSFIFLSNLIIVLQSSPTISRTTNRHGLSKRGLANRHLARNPARTLIGIISSDSKNDCTYRKRHREIFQIWNDTRVCSLNEIHDACQVIYTFIVGAGSQDSPTQLVNDSFPLLVENTIPSKYCSDLNSDDVSLLNIRENMNEGKSESFLYFASIMMRRHSIDYAMKLDADSILHLHEFLSFSQNNLPPTPYAQRVFAGSLRNKFHWPKPTSIQDYNRRESHWAKEYEHVHLYLAGQCYLLSLDLVDVVVKEAPRSWNLYREGHEDHDISAMAWQSEVPVTLITLGKSQRFWEHPVKGQPRWERIVKRETARMNHKAFEGKILKVY